jgi:hypothetical protein
MRGLEFLLTPVEFFGFLLCQVCVKLHTPPWIVAVLVTRRRPYLLKKFDTPSPI